jgi:hypothetical protein
MGKDRRGVSGDYASAEGDGDRDCHAVIVTTEARGGSATILFPGLKYAQECDRAEDRNLV